MNEEQLKLNAHRRWIGQTMIKVGVKQIWNAISDFSDVEGDFNRFKKSLLNLPVAELDSKYYFTSWENWQKVIETINPILQEFNWKMDRFDCDDRALLITALTSLFFEINTVRPVYCDVYRVGDGQFAFAHYANVIVDSDGNAWLWDADEFGLFTKITTTTGTIINNKRYVLKAVK